MYLKHVPTGDLVEVLDLTDVINPAIPTIRPRSFTGDVAQRAEYFVKTELTFPSNEPLPLCWCDSRYNEHAAA